MDVFEVDCSKLEKYVDREQIELWNLIVTEGQEAPEKLDREFESKEDRKRFVESIDSIIDTHKSNSSEMEFSEEHDWFYVRNEATLGNLLEFILPHKCEENNDLLYLTAVIMATIAESQIFADGNKRTAYLTGADFLLNVQMDKGMTENVVIPALDEELTQILQEVAVNKSSEDELYSFLDSLRNDINEVAEKQEI